jgi:hypothetical protein
LLFFGGGWWLILCMQGETAYLLVSFSYFAPFFLGEFFALALIIGIN